MVIGKTFLANSVALLMMRDGLLGAKRSTGDSIIEAPLDRVTFVATNRLSSNVCRLSNSGGYGIARRPPVFCGHIVLVWLNM